MKDLSRRLILCTLASLLAFTLPLVAADFGDAKDVKQVRKVVAAKIGKPLQASVSHDWALCTAYKDESDLSVVLHRIDGNWKVVESDGGAFDMDTLKGRGVPQEDIQPLLKAYQ